MIMSDAHWVKNCFCRWQLVITCINNCASQSGEVHQSSQEFFLEGLLACHDGAANILTAKAI